MIVVCSLSEFSNVCESINPSHAISVIDPGFEPTTPKGVSNHLKLGFDDIVNMEEDATKEITFVGFDVFYGFPLNGTAEIEITHYPEHGTISTPVFSQESTNNLAQWTSYFTPEDNYSGIDEIHFRVSSSNFRNELLTGNLEEDWFYGFGYGLSIHTKNIHSDIGISSLGDAGLIYGFSLQYDIN